MFNYLNSTDPMANRNRLLLTLVIVAILGLAIGANMGGGNKTTPATQTVTVPGETKTVTEYKTPQSCLDYITHSEEGFGYAEEALGYAGDAFQAASKLNASGIREANANMGSVKPKLEALTPKLQQAKSDCRASK